MVEALAQSVASQLVKPGRARIESTRPKSKKEPKTVRDCNPAVLMFKRLITRSKGRESNENKFVEHPTREEEVTTTEREFDAPRPCKHDKDVSDSHSVPSHPVCPALVMDVIVARPRCAPRTVMEVDPVAGELVRSLTLVSITVTFAWIESISSQQQQAAFNSGPSNITLILAPSIRTSAIDLWQTPPHTTGDPRRPSWPDDANPRLTFVPTESVEICESHMRSTN